MRVRVLPECLLGETDGDFSLGAKGKTAYPFQCFDKRRDIPAGMHNEVIDDLGANTYLPVFSKFTDYHAARIVIGDIYLGH